MADTRPANLEGFHPQDVIALRDPALTELLGTDRDHRYDGTPVGTREDNNRRAGWALAAVNVYLERVYNDSAEPVEQGVIDFVGDFLHLCDLLELDFNNLVERARAHYEAELVGEL